MVAGAVLNAPDSTVVGWAYFLSEFAPWLPGRTRELPDAPTCNTAYRASVLERVGGFPDHGLLSADSLLHWRLGRELGQGLLFVPGARVRHTYRGSAAVMLRRRFAHGQSLSAARRVFRPLGLWARLPWALGAALSAAALLPGAPLHDRLRSPRRAAPSLPSGLPLDGARSRALGVGTGRRSHEAFPGRDFAVSLSAVVTTYNGRTLLGPCIESLLAQTRPLDEIVIVDDASPDDDACVRARALSPGALPGGADPPAAAQPRPRRGGGRGSGSDPRRARGPGQQRRRARPRLARAGASTLRRSASGQRGDAPRATPLSRTSSTARATATRWWATPSRAGRASVTRRKRSRARCSRPVPRPRSSAARPTTPRAACVPSYRPTTTTSTSASGCASPGTPASTCPPRAAAHRVSASYGRGSFRQLALTSRNQAFMWWADMPASLLVRYLPEHALFFALQVVSRLFQGGLLPLLAGKAQALAQLPLAFRLRRDAQSRRSTGGPGLRSALERRWLRPGLADFRRRYFRSGA